MAPEPERGRIVTMAYSEDSCLTECRGSAEEDYNKTKVQYMILFFYRTGHGFSVNL